MRRNSDWQRYIASGRVGAVLNYVATSDWVVAWFPKLFELIRIQDLGSAGFDGFQPTNSLFQVRYVKGDHGAAITEKHWDDIAKFILNDPPIIPTNDACTREKCIEALGLFPPLVWTAIVAVLITIAWIIVKVCPNEVIRTLMLVAYSQIVWKVLTWF